MPRVSVIVPVYNTEKYLRECVDSILGQTFEDFELILVDDGSTDQSGVICDEYSKLDGRIKVIHQNNGGVTAARKQGAVAAGGEYISFIDSDDWIDSNMYRDMLTAADVNDADMVICDMLAEKPQESMLVRSSSLGGLFAAEQLEEQIYSNMLFDYSKNVPGLSLNLCNKLFRSSIAKPVFEEFPSDVTYGEDALGSLMCLLRSNRVFIMENAAYYHYRQTDEFLAREQRILLLPRLSSFALNTQIQFSKHGFGGMNQLSGYVAQVSLYCVRKILLFNKEHTMRKKLEAVADYFNEPHISEMLKNAEGLIADKTTKSKVKMVNKKRFRTLYLCFCAKELILRIRKCTP